MKQNPPCSKWHVWKGPEVEGTHSTGKGNSTLFIRSLGGFAKVRPTDDLSFLRVNSKCSRVWFCKEFTNWPLLLAIKKHFEETCIEVEPKCYDSIPKVLRETCRIYLKVDVPLKEGDVVCVGPAFSDESFEMGTGAKVKAEDYLQDKRII